MCFFAVNPTHKITWWKADLFFQKNFSVRQNCRRVFPLVHYAGISQMLFRAAFYAALTERIFISYFLSKFSLD